MIWSLYLLYIFTVRNEVAKVMFLHMIIIVIQLLHILTYLYSQKKYRIDKDNVFHNRTAFHRDQNVFFYIRTMVIYYTFFTFFFYFFVFSKKKHDWPGYMSPVTLRTV